MCKYQTLNIALYVQHIIKRFFLQNKFFRSFFTPHASTNICNMQISRSIGDKNELFFCMGMFASLYLHWELVCKAESIHREKKFGFMHHDYKWMENTHKKKLKGKLTTEKKERNILLMII